MKVFNEENIAEITCCDPPAIQTNSYLVCKIVISRLKEVTGVNAYKSLYKDKNKGLLQVFLQWFQISGGFDSFLLAIDSQVNL